MVPCRAKQVYFDIPTPQRKFIEICAKKLSWNTKASEEGIIWEGDGINEVGKRADTGKIVIKIDSRYFRPTELHDLKGDSSKIREKLKWKPKYSFENLIDEMIEFWEANYDSDNIKY